MRTVLPILLVLAAAGGLWLLLGPSGDGPGPEADWDDEGEARTAAPETGDGMRRVERAKAVAVLGEASGAALAPLDHAVAMELRLRFDPAAGSLSGGDLLDAIEAQADGKVPLLFASRASLERFRQLDLLGGEPTPATVHVQEALDWVQRHGYETREMDGRLMIRKARDP